MKNLTEQFSQEQLELMITTDHAQCGDVAALARIALALQDAPGKIYQIRKTDGSVEWGEWLEVGEAEFYADVSNDGWERRILYTAPVVSVPIGWMLVPSKPSQEHLNSIAMRDRHDFGLLPDNQRDGALAKARQMYEECTGQGFYSIPKPE